MYRLVNYVGSGSILGHDVRWRVLFVTVDVFLLLSVVWAVVGLIIGSKEIAWLGFVGACGSAVPLLVPRRLALPAFLTWILLELALIAIGHFVLPPEAQVEWMFLGCLGVPFLLFPQKRRRTVRIALLTLVIGLWSFVEVVDPTGPAAWVVEPDLAWRYVRPMVAISVIGVVVALAATFVVLARRNEQSLIEARRVAEEANKAKSDFLSVMSHELRTPMNGVIGMIEILQEGDLTAAQAQMLNTARDSSYALLSIVEDILDVSKIEEGKLQLVVGPTDIEAVVEGVVDTLRSFADRHHVRMALSFDRSTPQTCHADGPRLRQILMNILSNAIKFSRRPDDEDWGKVALDIQMLSTGEVQIMCRDDGIGIDPEFREQLFEPFVQSEAVTTRRFGGSGLGLSIVHRLVTKMGGSVEVESEPGKGATFTVRIPVVDPSEPRSSPDLTGISAYFIDLPWWQQDSSKKIASRSGVIPVFLGEGDVDPGTIDPDARAFVVTSDYSASGDLRPDRDAVPVPEGLRGFLRIHLSADRQSVSGLLPDGVYRIRSSPVLLSDMRKLHEFLAGNFKIADHQGEAGVETAGRGQPGEATVKEILLVEDNEINQIVIQTQLEGLGYRVVVTADGLEGLREWMAGNYALVLTDCHMPNMNGYQLAENIRELERTRGFGRTPIIAITADARPGHENECIAHGMDGFLTKPVSRVGLRKMLRNFLGHDAPAK